jgi:hypothetical protein
MRVDLFPRSCATQGFVVFDLTQNKETSYCDRHHIDQFFPLANEVFGCLHKQADVFLHDCANVIWSLKVLEGHHLFVLVTFFCQKISITLQKMQASPIINWAVAIGLATSQLAPLQDTPSITTADLL